MIIINRKTMQSLLSNSTSDMPASGIGVPRPRSHLKIAVLTIVVTAVVIVAVLIYILPLIGLGDITVGEMQLVRVTVNGVEYRFTKVSNMLGIYPLDLSRGGLESSGIFDPQEGETYQWLGIDIKIVEIHADKYVIRVTSRV